MKSTGKPEETSRDLIHLDPATPGRDLLLPPGTADLEVARKARAAKTRYGGEIAWSHPGLSGATMQSGPQGLKRSSTQA